MSHMHQYRILEREKQSKRLLESRLLLRAFQRLCEHWELSRKEGFELLGLNSLHQLSSWQSNTVDILLTDAQIERLSYLLSIHQALEQHFQMQPLAAGWIRDEHSLLSLNLDIELIPINNHTPLATFSWATKQQLRYLAQQIMDSDASLFTTPPNFYTSGLIPARA